MQHTRTSLFNKPAAAAAKSETFALRVDSYDTKGAVHTVTGMRLDTEEIVSVHLRDVPLNVNAKFKRPAIADFAARRVGTKPGTEPGGVLLIQEGVKQPNGDFGARWIQALSHSADEAYVLMGTVHVSQVKANAKGKQYALMTLLHDGKNSHLSSAAVQMLKLATPGKVGNMQELGEILSELAEANVGAGLRVRLPDGNFDAVRFIHKRDDEVATSVKSFIDRLPADLQDGINSGDVLAEIVPYGAVFAGPMTLEMMQTNKVMQSRLAKYNGGEGDKEVQFFRPSIIALRPSRPDAEGNRTVNFTHFEPLYTSQPRAGLTEAMCYVKTEDFAPELGAEVSAPVAAPPVGKSPAGNDTGESFSADFDDIADDDIVGAVADASDDIGAPVDPEVDAKLAQAAKRMRK